MTNKITILFFLEKSNIYELCEKCFAEVSGLSSTTA